MWLTEKPKKRRIKVKAVIVEDDDGSSDRMIYGEDLKVLGYTYPEAIGYFFSGGAE